MATGKPTPAIAAKARRRAVVDRRAPKRPPAGYHHGDLRQALLDATEQLLDEAGLEGFTLREVARRAGVSHGAPAHHFVDVRGLLSAFTAQSFAQLAGAMAARRAAAPPEAWAQLAAAGLGYVEYALSHRARFQLMFRSDRLDHGHAPLAEAAARSYAHLVDCARALATEADDGEATARRIALAWSIVHGYATLMLDNRAFAAQAEGDPRRALALVASLLEMSRPGFTGRS